MALNSMGLGFVFTAKDLATGTMRKVEGKFKKLDSTTDAAAKTFTKNVGTMVAGLGMMAAGAAGVGTALSLAKAAGNFQMQLQAVGQITRASAEDMDMLREKALDVGLRTKFSPDQIIEGLKNLGAAGLSAAQSAEAIEPAALLATSAQIELADASKAVIGTVRSFKLETKDAALVADKLTRSMQLSNIQGADMGSGLAKASAVMGGFGQTLDTTLALFGALRNMNVDASSSGTALRESVRRLASDTAAQNAVTKHGVDIYDKTTGKMRDMGEVMFDLIEKTAHLSQEEKDRIAVQAFGARGLLAFKAAETLTTKVMRDGVEVTLSQRDAYKELTKATEDATGTNKAFNEALLSTFEGQQQILSGAVDTLKVVLGEGFADVLKPLVKLVAESVSTIAKAFRNMPTPLKRALSGLFLVVSAMVMLGGTLIAAVGAFALIKMAVLAFAGPLLIAAKVLGVVVLAGLALAGMFALLKNAFDKNIGGFGDKLRGIFDRVKLFFDAVGQLMSGDGKLRGEVLMKLLDPANKGVLSMVQRFQQLRHRVTRFFGGIKDGFDIVMQTAGPVFAKLGAALERFMEALGFGSKSLSLLTSSSEDWSDSGKNIGEVIGDLVVLFITGLAEAIDLATGAVRTMKAAWVVLEPILAATMSHLALLGNILGFLTYMISDTTRATDESSSSMSDYAKSIAVPGSAFGGLRKALFNYKTVLDAVDSAHDNYHVAANRVTKASDEGYLSFLSVGTALHDLLNSYTDVNRAVDAYVISLTEEGRAVASLEDAYKNTLKVRGQIAAFDSIEAAAKAKGMGTVEFANKRAQEIAGMDRSKALGLDQAEIKRRLMLGEEVYQKKDYDKVAAEKGAEVVHAASQGEADKGKASEQRVADAVARGVRDAQTSQPVTLHNTVKIGDEKVAEALKKFDALEAAANFEV